jgi:hypothetical protein
METNIFTPPVRKTDKCILVLRLCDTGKHLIEQTDVYTNRTKVYKYLSSLGTVYASRNGNNFNKPLLTYKTFTQHLNKCAPLVVHVAGTGAFLGRYLISIQSLK